MAPRARGLQREADFIVLVRGPAALATVQVRDIDDAGMLQLLEPWRGQRQRVVRLLLSGGPRRPRRGPRFAPTDYRRI